MKTAPSHRQRFDILPWSYGRLAQKFAPESVAMMLGHITTDASVGMRNSDFYRCKGSTHDGTLLFTWEIMSRLLAPLVYRESFPVSRPPDWPRLKEIKYTIGLCRQAVVSGRFDINGTMMWGQRERMRLPVRVEYVYGGELTLPYDPVTKENRGLPLTKLPDPPQPAPFGFYQYEAGLP